MKKLDITILKKEQRYPLVIGQSVMGGILDFFPLTHYTTIFVVTDETVAPLFLDKLLTPLEKAKHLILPAGESAKNIESVQKIWTAMKEAQCDRKSLVINLGGGVVCDMGGFAASTYMRGVDFINIPTTLLSQVDASVGGKTGFDFAGVKNFIGTFTQPQVVIIDVETLSSLPKRAFVSGFAEIIKHGLIADKNYFHQVTAKKPLEFTQEELVDIITKSCEIKRQVVQEDETESNKRKLLNFGHTIGHALEALSLDTDNPLLHGEAVSIGMTAEAKLSEYIGLLSTKDFETIKQSLHNAGLPTSLRDHEMTKSKIPEWGQSFETIFQKMKLDKKNDKGNINFTLLKTIGEGIINQNTVPSEMIEQAIAYITQ